MLVIEDCKNTKAVTVFIRGGNKMVRGMGLQQCLFVIFSNWLLIPDVL